MGRSRNENVQNLKIFELLLSFQFGEILEFQEKRVEVFGVFDFRVGSCRQAIRKVLISRVGCRRSIFLSSRTFQGYDQVR